MKKLIYFLIINLFTLSSFASWNDCTEQVEKLLPGAREQQILSEKKIILEQAGLSTCDGSISLNLMTAIHEGVHFMDLGVSTYSDLTLNPDASSIELFLTDSSRLPAPKNLNLPSPYDVLESMGDDWNTFQTVKKNESFVDDYREYILDTEMLSSRIATYGLGTEFNAYAHGALSSKSVFDNLISELLIVRIQPLIAQRSGLMLFTGITLAYFRILKEKKPESYKSIINNSSAVNFYGALFEQGHKALEQSKSCINITEYEIGFAESTYQLIDEGILKDFSLSFSKADFLQAAICR